MIQANPNDDTIRESTGIMLMDSSRKFYEPVGQVKTGGRERLTILVDSTDLASLDDWRQRITTLRAAFGVNTLA